MGSINVPSVSMKLLKTVKYVLELQVISIHEHGGLRMVRSLQGIAAQDACFDGVLQRNAKSTLWVFKHELQKMLQ